MKQKKKVTLSTIADKLKISTVTVSKALADKDGVGDELRSQIKKIAQEMGYRKKEQSSNNKFGQVTGNIGILIQKRFFSPEVSYYWHIFKELSTELLSRGYYSIMEILSYEDEKKNNIPHIIQDKKVDGLIILGQTNDDYLLTIKNAFPNFILFDFYSTKNQFDSVSNDDYFCSYKITNYVLSQGHKKVCFVGNFNATTSITDRYMGFQRALLEHGIKPKLKDIINDRDEDGNPVDFTLPVHNMPTAFVCNCDETAENLILRLQSEGFRVPEEISVTGFDNYLSNKKINIGLTTVFIDPKDSTSTAADILIKKISSQPYIKGRHVISGNIVIRDSVSKK